MSRHIHANFDSKKEALEAKRYLEDSGYENVEIQLSQVRVETEKENWMGAFEVANSLGASWEEDSDFVEEFEEHYHISNTEDRGDLLEEEVLEDDEEIDMIDPDAYIDMNLGFGDFEIIEPYVLHTYHQITDGEKK